MPSDAPSIKPSPGDLLMILRTGLLLLEKLKEESPHDSAAVDAIASTTQTALDHWLMLRAAQQIRKRRTDEPSH